MKVVPTEEVKPFATFRLVFDDADGSLDYLLFSDEYSFQVQDLLELLDLLETNGVCLCSNPKGC